MARTISSQRTVADGRLNIIPLADIVIRDPFLEDVDWFILSDAVDVMMNIASDDMEVEPGDSVVAASMDIDAGMDIDWTSDIEPGDSIVAASMNIDAGMNINWTSDIIIWMQLAAHPGCMDSSIMR